MININGEITTSSKLTSRAFLYGDALFDTLLLNDTHLVFLEAHYFRLLAGMRQLRMEIPPYFTQSFWKEEILRISTAKKLKTASIRTTIYRNAMGRYTPSSNNIVFIIEARALNKLSNNPFALGIYKDNFVNTNSINTIKTTNRIINVLASIYAKEQGLSTCILLNHNKHIAETIQANLFAVYGNQIKTPALSEGCVRGITREKIIQLIQKHPSYSIEETSLSPFELQHADEVFVTNSIGLIQPVSVFKKKIYRNLVTSEIQELLDNAIAEDQKNSA